MYWNIEDNDITIIGTKIYNSRIKNRSRKEKETILLKTNMSKNNSKIETNVNNNYVINNEKSTSLIKKERRGRPRKEKIITIDSTTDENLIKTKTKVNNNNFNNKSNNVNNNTATS